MQQKVWRRAARNRAGSERPVPCRCRFPANDHIDRQLRQFQHLAAQCLHAGRYAEQRGVQAGSGIGLLMQAAVFQHQLAFLEGAPQVADQGFRAEGFFQKVIGPFAHRLHSHRHIAMTGQEDDRQVAVCALQPGQQLQTAHAWHAHIGQHDAGEVFR